MLDGPLQVAYYAGRERGGEPVLVEPGDRGWFTFTGPFTPEVPDEFSMRITGTLGRAGDAARGRSGSCRSAGPGLTIDGEVVVDNWEPTGRSEAFMGFASAEVTGTVDLVAGEPHAARGRVRARRAVGGRARDRLHAAAPPDLLERAVALAARADVVVCVVGTDGDWETEGNDRESMALPPPQDELVRAVAAVNPRTVVVVNAASPVDDGLGRRRGRGAAVLVRGRGVGPRARRRALG